MKKYFLLHIILFSVTAFCQQEDLLDKHWYFDKMEISGETIFRPTQFPEAVCDFSYVGNEGDSGDVFFGGLVCNWFQLWNSTIDDHTISFEQFVHTFLECVEFIEVEAFDNLSLTFYTSSYNEEEMLYSISYEIVEMDEYLVLILTNLNDDKIYFKTENLSTINASNIAVDIKIYPNPTKETVHIESAIPILKILVYDISGKLVKALNDNQRINIGDLPDGTYLIQVETEKGNFTKKIVKE